MCRAAGEGAADIRETCKVLALLVECLYEAIAYIDAPLQKILRNCFQVSAGGHRNELGADESRIVTYLKRW